MGELRFPVHRGFVLIAWNDQGLISRISWTDEAADVAPYDLQLPWPEPPGVETPPVVRDLFYRLRNYFDRGTPIEEVPWDRLEQTNWSPFQRKVYEAITHIPHGETRTYGWVAHRIGKFAATRAVGQALRNNPLPVLIPCHRVVATNSLGGFMGVTDESAPEIKLKRTLLALEDGYRQPHFAFFTAAQPLFAMG